MKVHNNEEGHINMWEMSKFSNRYFLIKDILENYFETNEPCTLKQDDDPFWDPPEPYFMGQVTSIIS